MSEIFDAIINFLKQCFLLIHDNLIAVIISNPNVSYGIAVIVFTIIIRTCLLPLNLKQMRNQLKMTELQPELKKLQEKYKKDPQKANEEVMKFYKEKGVNPMAGCLPLLIQMPILFALFYVFRDLFISISPQPSFLWITNLGLVEPNFVIGSFDTHIKFLPIISGITTFISSSLIAVKGDDAQSKQTAIMNKVMSVMIIFMSWNMNAALVIYWIMGNLYQMTQTYIMKKANSKQKKEA